jgi:hypothetical protein
MPSAGAVPRLSRVFLAAALALSWLLAAGGPAHAVESCRIESPSAGARVQGATTITVGVRANRFQQVDSVQVWLLRGGQQVGPIRGTGHAGGSRSGGESRWTTPLDPMASWAAGGGPMANGPYTVQARVTWTAPMAGQQTTTCPGHDVIVDAAPPATSVSAQVIDADARSVEVSWTPVDLPDFRRYVVQRAGADGGWADVATLGTASTTRFVDAAPEPGVWRYRVAVVRAGGDGGDRRTESAERSVEIDEPAPSDPDTPTAEPRDPSEESTPGATPSPDDGEGDGDGSGEGDGSAGASGGSAAPPTRPAGRASVPRVRSSSPAPPVAQAPPPPSVSSPGSDVFEETLTYPDPEPVEVVEETAPPVRRGEALEGGSLAIYDRELALEELLPPLAGGLLLFVVAGHVLRLRMADTRR